jgi:hypothetical protein
MTVSSRRSSRARSSGATKGAIVAAGNMTKKDIAKLTKELNEVDPAENPMSEKLVTAIMNCDGGGINGEEVKTPSKSGSGSGNPLTSPGTTSAWASFMQEEGVSLSTSSAPSTAVGSSRSATKRDAQQDAADKKKKQAALSTSNDGDVQYDFEGLAAFDDNAATTSSRKKLKLSATTGTLVQTGTLDPTMVGRSRLDKEDAEEPYHLTLPTIILPKIAIASVAASCSAAHAVAIDANGTAYGWGRNEQVCTYEYYVIYYIELIC